MPLNKVANLGQGENTDACLSPSRRWRAAEESEGRMIEIEVGYWEGVIVGKTPGLSREGWGDTQDMLSSLFLSHTHTHTHYG